MQQKLWFGKYRILRLLGEGGTARVYLAEHINLNSYRVIKCISKKHPLYNHLRNEALLLKDLKHYCIPIIYDIEENEEGSYIVEQYLEGDTLKNCVFSKGPFQEDIILNYALQLCDLLLYLHNRSRPILYVDLKPENIILSGNMLKLVDFGSALFADELKADQPYYGTRGYAAPELYRRKKIDERCDIYGIGILMYFMATGHVMAGNHTIMNNIDANKAYSSQLKSIINHCLRYHPSQRYTTVKQIKKQISAVSRKSRYPDKSSQKYTISVAGVQPRIGVTHFSFRICNYLIGQRKTCLYREENESGCVRAIENCYENIAEREGYVVIEGIRMLAKERALLQCCGDYQVTVSDYGVLTRDNLECFLSADIKLLISGAKDWEIAYSEQVLNRTAKYKDIAYLFNFLDGRQFTRIIKNMEHRKCYRIPYEPDPFARILDRGSRELFEDLLLPPEFTGRQQDGE